MKYLVGIDGGGTKTLGRIICQKSGKQLQIRGGASSLTNDFEGALATINQLCTELLQGINTTADQCVVVMGLAGGSVQVNVQKLQQQCLHTFAHLYVCNDAVTSLYGARNGSPVAMVALGTGSVGARLDESGQVHFVGGWGFKAGDQGSGAKLGLMAVQQLLLELDKYEQPVSDLAKAVATKAGGERSTVLNWLVQASPADFATFSEVVFSQTERCDEAKAIVEVHLQHVEELINLARGKTSLPLVMLGGLAVPTQALLSDTINQFLVESAGTALDGACYLAKLRCQQLLEGNTDHAV